MLGKAFVIGLLVALLVAATPAAAFDGPSQLSSWQPIFEGREVTGGTRTVTVVNHFDSELTGVAFDLGERPCICATLAAFTSHGQVADSTWFIGTLGPGETATLRLMLGSHPPVVAAPSTSFGAFAVLTIHGASFQAV